MSKVEHSELNQSLPSTKEIIFNAFFLGTGQRVGKVNHELTTRYENIQEIDNSSVRQTKIIYDGPTGIGGAILGIGVEDNIDNFERQLQTIIEDEKEKNPSNVLNIKLNLFGFSRGAVQCFYAAERAANLAESENIKLDLTCLAIDPVPGPKRPKRVILPKGDFTIVIMLNEGRIGFTPIDIGAIARDPTQTKINYRVMYGPHSGGTKVTGAWTVAPTFLINGIINDEMGLQNKIDGFKQQGVAFANGGVEIRPYDARENTPQKQLSHYTEMRRHPEWFAYQGLNLNIREMNDPRYRGFIVRDADYFLDQKHRELFQLQYKKVFDFFFQRNVESTSREEVYKELERMWEEDHLTFETLIQYNIIQLDETNEIKARGYPYRERAFIFTQPVDAAFQVAMNICKGFVLEAKDDLEFLNAIYAIRTILEEIYYDDRPEVEATNKQQKMIGILYGHLMQFIEDDNYRHLYGSFFAALMSPEIFITLFPTFDLEPLLGSNQFERMLDLIQQIEKTVNYQQGTGFKRLIDILKEFNHKSQSAVLQQKCLTPANTHPLRRDSAEERAYKHSDRVRAIIAPILQNIQNTSPPTALRSFYNKKYDGIKVKTFLRLKQLLNLSAEEQTAQIAQENSGDIKRLSFLLNEQKKTLLALLSSKDKDLTVSQKIAHLTEKLEDEVQKNLRKKIIRRKERHYNRLLDQVIATDEKERTEQLHVLLRSAEFLELLRGFTTPMQKADLLKRVVAQFDKTRMTWKEACSAVLDEDKYAQNYNALIFHGTSSVILDNMTPDTAVLLAPQYLQETPQFGEGNFFVQKDPNEIAVGEGSPGMGTALAYAMSVVFSPEHNPELYSDQELAKNLEYLNMIIRNYNPDLVHLEKDDLGSHKTKEQFEVLQKKLQGEFDRRELKRQNPHDPAVQRHHQPLILAFDKTHLEVRNPSTTVAGLKMDDIDSPRPLSGERFVKKEINFKYLVAVYCQAAEIPHIKEKLAALDLPQRIAVLPIEAVLAQGNAGLNANQKVENLSALNPTEEIYLATKDLYGVYASMLQNVLYAYSLALENSVPLNKNSFLEYCRSYETTHQFKELTLDQNIKHTLQDFYVQKGPAASLELNQSALPEAQLTNLSDYYLRILKKHGSITSTISLTLILSALIKPYTDECEWNSAQHKFFVGALLYTVALQSYSQNERKDADLLWQTAETYFNDKELKDNPFVFAFKIKAYKELTSLPRIKWKDVKDYIKSIALHDKEAALIYVKQHHLERKNKPHDAFEQKIIEHYKNNLEFAHELELMRNLIEATKLTTEIPEKLKEINQQLSNLVRSLSIDCNFSTASFLIEQMTQLERMTNPLTIQSIINSLLTSDELKGFISPSSDQVLYANLFALQNSIKKILASKKAWGIKVVEKPFQNPWVSSENQFILNLAVSITDENLFSKIVANLPTLQANKTELITLILEQSQNVNLVKIVVALEVLTDSVTNFENQDYLLKVQQFLVDNERALRSRPNFDYVQFTQKISDKLVKPIVESISRNSSSDELASISRDAADVELTDDEIPVSTSKMNGIIKPCRMQPTDTDPLVNPPPAEKSETAINSFEDSVDLSASFTSLNTDSQNAFMKKLSGYKDKHAVFSYQCRLNKNSISAIYDRINANSNLSDPLLHDLDNFLATMNITELLKDDSQKVAGLALVQAITDLEKKSDNLAARPLEGNAIEASKVAKSVAKELLHETKIYFCREPQARTPQIRENFKNVCENNIAPAKSVLAQNRNSHIISNIAVAVLKLVDTCIEKIGSVLFDYKGCLFSKTDSTKKLENIENKISEIQQLVVKS